MSKVVASCPFKPGDTVEGRYSLQRLIVKTICKDGSVIAIRNGVECDIKVSDYAAYRVVEGGK